MSQILIEFRPGNFYPPRSGVWAVGKITFVPGVKAYSSEDWEEIKSQASLANIINICLEEGILRVVSQSNKSKNVKSAGVQNLPADIQETPPLPKNQTEAIALVKKTYSLSLLTGWQRIEKRKAVLEAISAQLKTDEPPVNIPPPKEEVA